MTPTEPSGANPGSPAFLAEPVDGTIIADLPVLTLDAIVAQSRLNRVDFIKMDIEGSEHFALRSARGTLRRFKPRMAIYTYHLLDDPVVVRLPPVGLYLTILSTPWISNSMRGGLRPRSFSFACRRLPPPNSWDVEQENQGHGSILCMGACPAISCQPRQAYLLKGHCARILRYMGFPA